MADGKKKKEKAGRSRPEPPDLRRRLQRLEQTWGQPATEEDAEDDPALRELPAELRELAALAPARLAGGADTVVLAHERLDAPELSEAQLAALNMPQAATAVTVAREQVMVLAGLPPDLRCRFPVGAEALAEPLGKHGELCGINRALLALLEGVDLGLLAVRAARGAARRLIDEAVAGLLEELPPADPLRDLLTARRATVEELKEKQDQKEAKKQAQKEGFRRRAQALLDETEHKQLLAEVWEQLQRGEMPDYETLLEAARYLRQQQETSGGTR